MRGRSRRPALLALGIAALLLAPAPASAQTRPGAAGKPAPPRPRPDSAEQLARASAEVLRATREYRASLERLLAVYESDVSRATELVEEHRALFAQGLISRSEVEEAELARITAEDNLNETRVWIEEADRVLLEANLSEELSRLPPLPVGGFQATAAFIRYSGFAKWSLADAPKVQRFFAARFGRALPVSAFGQTAAHDRIGFDHRHAVDVAVHPDTPEGQALAEHLRQSGVSFVAFRHAVPGAATGAHFHIGEPSPRIVTRTRR